MLAKTTQVALIDLSMIADCTPDSESLTAEDLTSPEFFKYCAILSEHAEQLIEKRKKIRKQEYQSFFQLYRRLKQFKECNQDAVIKFEAYFCNDLSIQRSIEKKPDTLAMLNLSQSVNNPNTEFCRVL